MNSSGARNPASWPLLVTLFSAMVLVTYFPVLTGKVPLPSHLVLQYPAWVGTEKPTPTPVATIGDLITFAYPSRLFASRTVQQLKLPLWNPYISSGVPFVADAQSAVFYPLNILGYVMPMATAWSLGLMLRLFLAAVFMALFAHSIGASRTGSVVAATIFGWCGFNTAWQGYAMGDAAIWLPLMCYAVHRLSTSSSSKYLALAAFAFSMPMLAGHPETAAHLCLAVVVFAIAVQSVPAIGLPNQTGFIRRMTVAGCLALGIAAIQMLPTVEWVGQIVHNLYSEWPTLPLSQALGVVSRDIQHGPNSAAIAIPEAASYVGMLSLLIAPFAAFHANRRYVIALAIVTVLAFTAAFGVPPIGWIVTHTPLLKAIKNQRLILVSSFGIASLAGLGVSVLQQESLMRKHRRTAAAIVTGALGVGLGLVYALQRTTTFRVAVMQRPSFSRALLIVSAIAVITALSGRLRGRALSVSLGAIVAFDLVTFSYGYTTFSQPKNIFPPAPVFDFLAAHVDPNQYRIAGLSGAYTGNAQIAYRVAAADGYDIPLQRTWRFHEGLRVDQATPLEFMEDAILSSQDRRLDLLNVKYLVANTADPDFHRMQVDPRFANVFQKGYVAVFENKTVFTASVCRSCLWNRSDTEFRSTAQAAQRSGIRPRTFRADLGTTSLLIDDRSSCRTFHKPDRGGRA
jgi:hypothetical protein